MSLYEDLGVAPDATQDEIKAAARKKQKATHPDAGGSKDEFQKVQNAVRILSDPEKRERYDRTGSTDGRSQEDYRQQEAVQLVSNLITQRMNEDARWDDMVASIRATINGMIATDKSKLAQAEGDCVRLCAKIDQRLERLKPPQNGPDMLGDMLRAQKSQYERSIVQFRIQTEDRLAIYAAALAMAEGYGYEVDEQPPQPNYYGRPGGPTLGDVFGNPEELLSKFQTKGFWGNPRSG